MATTRTIEIEKIGYELFECVVDITIAVIAVVALSLALSHGEVRQSGIPEQVCLDFPHIPPCVWYPPNATDSADSVCSCVYNYDYEYAVAVLVLVIFVHASKLFRKIKLFHKKGCFPTLFLIVTTLVPLGWSIVMVSLIFTGTLSGTSPLAAILIYIVAGLLFVRCTVEFGFSIWKIYKARKN